MIDRNVPRKFVADKDERLLEVGDMIEAQNITITQRGEGSGSIVKTMKGTTARYSSADTTNLEAAVTVIGKAEDTQRNQLYFFVASNSGNANDMIIQYDPTKNVYTVIFKDSWLNFSTTNFIKADVVNKAFQQDGNLQTIIYFTDNDNPPRKINVDRALAGDYDNRTNTELDFMLSVARAAPNDPPTTYFTTDSDFYSNNFLNDSFQFATQIIFTDGEESALSPYSKITYSKSIAYQGAEDGAALANNDNVCVVKINYDNTIASHSHIADVEKIRLLARAGNDGGFFVVDEFDPTADLTRNIYGSDVVVFDASARNYKFYNEGSYQFISDNVSNKLYDNVPLKAEGQSFIGNRLMYSNYNEGRANTNVSASISVNYASPFSVAGGYGDGTGTNTVTHVATLSNGDIQISLVGGDFTWATPNNATSIVPAGSTTRIEFEYDQEGSFYGSSSGVIVLDAVDDNGDDLVIKFGYGSSNTIPIELVSNNPQISIVVTNEDETTVAGLADLIQEFFNSGVYETKSYSATSILGEVVSTTGSLYSPGDPISIDATVSLNYAFNETVTGTANDGIFIIKPYITFASFSNIDVGAETFTPTTQTFATSDEQSDFTYSITNTSSYIQNPNVFSSATQTLRSFKAGSTHELGVVYYDKYNRSSFVNKIGSFYVEPLSNRTSGEEGPASIEVQFNSEPPSWATAFQIVYPGSSTYQDFVQYTVGKAYPAVDSAGNLLNNKHEIYVSLKTLSLYQEEKSAIRDYSFTAGDKLRVISYDSASSTTPSIVYPSANDGSPVEFDVIGVVTFADDANNKIKGVSAGDDEIGDFLILQAPAIDSGLQVDTDSDGVTDADLKYVGFDWYSINGVNYPNDTNSTVTNHWGKRCVVEILTPRKTVSSKPYYEIGESRRANVWTDPKYTSQHGPSIKISEGDVHIRQVSCKTPWYDTSVSDWNRGNPDAWRYEAISLESRSISDYFESNDWSRGRSHTVFENAANINRYNGITYSDAYADDAATLKLSSFNPSLANFFDLPSEYGRCSFIGKLNDKLLAVQEGKCSLVEVDKDIIQTGSGSGLVSLSTKVLGNVLPFGGDYGTQNPESVLIRDGSAYVADKARAVIFRLTMQGLNPISEIDIKSYVESRFGVWENSGGTKIISGYDPDDDIYYATLLADSDTNSTTIGWDAKRNFWQGTYTFYPDIYASVRDKFFFCKYQSVSGGEDMLIHEFTDISNSNNFVTGIKQSKVTVVSNYNPSMVKQYNSISLEGDSAWTTTLESSTGQTTANLVFDEKEDAFYANVTGDTSSNSTNQYIPIGTVASIDGNVVTMTNNLRGIHIPVGYSVFKNNAGTAYTQITGNPTVSSVDRPNSKITVSSGVNISPNDKLFVANTGGITGDQIRGHYCKIKCSIYPTSTQKKELYSINANFVNSKANHALGQQ